METQRCYKIILMYMEIRQVGKLISFIQKTQELLLFLLYMAGYVVVLVQMSERKCKSFIKEKHGFWFVAVLKN